LGNFGGIGDLNLSTGVTSFWGARDYRDFPQEKGFSPKLGGDCVRTFSVGDFKGCPEDIWGVTLQGFGKNKRGGLQIGGTNSVYTTPGR